MNKHVGIQLFYFHLSLLPLSVILWNCKGLSSFALQEQRPPTIGVTHQSPLVLLWSQNGSKSIRQKSKRACWEPAMVMNRRLATRSWCFIHSKTLLPWKKRNENTSEQAVLNVFFLHSRHFWPSASTQWEYIHFVALAFVPKRTKRSQQFS